MLIVPAQSEVSVVLVGSFNPAIFGPKWLYAQKLISDEVHEDAEVEIITPHIARFEVASFSFEVTRSRFQLVLKSEPFVLLSDMVFKIFVELLPHTKVDIFGLNRSVHFSVGSETERNRIGRLIAPVEPWGAWADEWKDLKYPHSSGVVDVTMTQMHPGDKYNRKTTAIIQPSVVVKGASGIFMTVNDNFECADFNAGAAAAVLTEHFDSFLSRSVWIIDQIMRLKGSKQ